MVISSVMPTPNCKDIHKEYRTTILEHTPLLRKKQRERLKICIWKIFYKLITKEDKCIIAQITWVFTVVTFKHLNLKLNIVCVWKQSAPENCDYMNPFVFGNLLHHCKLLNAWVLNSFWQSFVIISIVLKIL